MNLRFVFYLEKETIILRSLIAKNIAESWGSMQVAVEW